MTSDPLVSVVVTVFKRTDYLEQAIGTVRGQSFANFEILVADDADSARAKEICGKFASDPRVRYRSNPVPLGTAMNIAAAIREVRGEFVCILNDDDLMEPRMLEVLIAPLRDSAQVVVSFADHWMIDEKGEILHELTNRNSTVRGRIALKTGLLEDPLSFALRGGVLMVMGALFRLSRYQECWLTGEVAGAYDYWLAIQFATTGGAFAYVSEKVMSYRVHSNSESANLNPSKASGEVWIFDQLLQTPLRPRDRKFVQSRLAHFLFVRGRDQLLFGKASSARHDFRRSFLWRPGIRVAAGILLTFLPSFLWRAFYTAWRRLRKVPLDSLPWGARVF